jgi:hypothetical protein
MYLGTFTPCHENKADRKKEELKETNYGEGKYTMNEDVGKQKNGCKKTKE